MKNKKRLFGALVIVILALTMIATLAACGEEETVQYTVTLKSGFDDQVTTQTLNEGEVFTLPASPFTRDGYTFDYWTEEGTTYPNQVGTPIPVYSNMTFVAHWTENYVPDVPEDFTVTVKDGYGSGQITAVVTEGEEYVLPAADTFTRPEYTFGGWQVGDSVLAAGDSVTITANTEIVAVWNAIPKYNVSVLKGYGDNAPIATAAVNSGGSYTLPVMTLTRDGYEFLGYKEEDSDELLPEETVIENITSDTTFVAVWEEITYYTIYLKKTADATGTDVDNSNKVAEGGSFILPECNFVNAGYEFTGWIYEGQPMDPGDVIPNITGDIEVIAGWKLAEEPQPEQYSVTFANGKYSMAGGSYTEEEAYIIPEGSDTYYDAEEGYKFVGWTVKGDDSGKIYKPGDRYSGNSDVIFVAQWDEIIYYSIYLSAGFEGGATALVSDKVEEGTSYRYTLPQADKFSREGYTFAGWKIGEETYSAGETVNLTVDKNITITAVWEAIPTYTVTYYYELNGAQISVSSAMYSGTEYDLIDYPADQTPPTGMKFDGWKLVGGDETVYPAGTRITVSGNAEYYAVYRDAVFTVEFSDGEKVQSSEVKEGGNVEIPAAPEKTGYTFLGWYLNGEGEALKGEHVYNVTNDMRFEAKWQINSYEITFEIVYDNGFNANYEFKKEVLTVEYNNLPEPTIEIPEKIDFTDDKAAYFSGEWMIKNEAGEWTVSEILPATKDITYRAEVEIGARLYPVEFVQNDYVSFEIKGDDGQFTPVAEDGVVYVEYKEDLTFRLVRAPGVYVDNVKVVCNTDQNIIPNETGGYILEFSIDSKIAVSGWEFAEYEIEDVSVTHVEYSGLDVLNGYRYGDIVTVLAKGAAGYTHKAPIVTFNGEDIAPISAEPDENGYYQYNLVMTRNSTVEIDGVLDVIPIIFVDIFGVEYTLEYNVSMGPLGNKIPIENNTVKDGANDYQLTYLWRNKLGGVLSDEDFTDAEYSQIDANISVYAYSIGRPQSQIIDQYDYYLKAKELLLDPYYPTEPMTVYLYYLRMAEDSYYLDVVLPLAATGLEYFIEDESTDWCDLYAMEYTFASTGHLNVARLQHEIPDGIPNFTPGIWDKTFAAESTVYLKINLPDGIEPPALVNSRDSDLKAEFGTYVVNGKEEQCYKIVTSYAEMEYVPESNEAYKNTITFDCKIKNNSYSIYGKEDLNPKTMLEKLFAEDGSDLAFKIKYNTAYTDVEAMFDKGNGWQPKVSLFDVNGSYENISYSAEEDTSELVVTVTISNITSDLVISDINVVDAAAKYTMPVVINEYYDYYIDGVKVEGEVGETVYVPVQNSFTVEIRLHDDLPYTFVIKSSNGYSVRTSWTYKNSEGAVQKYLGFGGTISDDSRSIKATLSQYTTKDRLDFVTGVEFLYIDIGYQAEQTETDTNVTVIPDKSFLDPEESVTNLKFYHFVNVDKKFEVEVQLVKGKGLLPVLYIERANMLADSFRAYDYYEAKDNGDGTVNYLFEVAGLDSEIRWYIDTEVEEFDVTFVNGDGTETVLSVPYGTKVTDIEGLPTYYMLSTETGTEFYRIYGWSATQGGAQLDENAVVAGDATYYALGEVTEAALSFTYDGGVAFYNTLADALNDDIVKNNEGVLDIFYGKTDESLTEGAYTIPAGVTLRLPYATGEYGREYGGTSGVSRFYADKADGFTSLVIAAGVTLNVEGTISVGGVIGYAQSAMPYQGQTSGKHAILELNGTMNVLSGGVLNVNGYIVGTGTVELATGGASYLPFIVKDYRGGTNTDRMYSRGITPFNIYEMPNIQTEYIINYGAVEYAYAVLYASSMFNEAIVEVIGTNGIIKPAEGGKVVKKTTEIENPRYSTATSSYEPQYEYRTTLDIYGGGNDGFLSLDILGLVTVTTEDFFLGIPYTYQRITLHDGEYSIVNKFKVMPGATLEIADDAILTIESTGAIAVYEDDFDETRWTTQLNSKKQLAYPVNPNRIPEGDGVKAESGVLKVGGTLVINGSLGGLITADESENLTPTVKLKRVVTGSTLQIETNEGVYMNSSEYQFDVTYKEPDTDEAKVLVAYVGDIKLAYDPDGGTMIYRYSDNQWMQSKA